MNLTWKEYNDMDCLYSALLIAKRNKDSFIYCMDDKLLVNIDGLPTETITVEKEDHIDYFTSMVIQRRYKINDYKIGKKGDKDRIDYIIDKL